MTFQKLNIIEPILKALKQEGYQTPTPIQQQAIPTILQGKDIWACAQTGTGKTAAFVVPVIQKLHQGARTDRGKTVKTLILTPTRELAVQIGENISAYGRYLQLDHCVVFGGIAQKYQIERIKSGVDIIIATPGRLLDLIRQDLLVLKSIEFVILDEADRMLDMGFAHDVKHICSLLPQKKQSMLFSATLPKEVVNLAGSILKNPVKIEVNPPASTADIIEQSLYYVEKNNKINLLVSLLREGTQESVLVFSRTKHGADKIARALSSSGIPAESIHGNKSQFARQTTLNNFKEHKTRVLVATDVAARGIDIEGLTHVFNFDLPEVAETYVHRIGRTGRAGLCGFAISFVDSEQASLLRGIERLINQQIPVIEGHRYDEKVLAAQKPKRESTENPA
ncbi:MAG: DEAD/DEAH box helicase, partial [Bacteroidales bacterium]